MFSYTFSGTTVLLGLGGLCLLIALSVHLMRRRLSSGKRVAADVFGYTPAIYRVSLCAALLSTFLAINWTQYDDAPIYAATLTMDEDIETIVPITFQAPKPPPPLPPPIIIEPTPDLEVESVKLIDQSILEDDAVLAVVPKPLAPKRIAPPPPPAPPAPVEVDPPIVIFAERMPVFGDCAGLSGEARKTCSDRNLLGFLMKHLKYPSVARGNGIQGTVYLKFVVERDGSVSGIEVVRGQSGGLTDAALEAVHQINAKGQHFEPGIQAGTPVRVAFNLPIKFTLE